METCCCLNNWKDSSGTYIWMWWHLCISSNFTTSWKLKSCVWERSRMQPVIKAASSQACSENVFVCDLRPVAGSLNQDTFAFRYLLLKCHYWINYYIVVFYCFLENCHFYGGKSCKKCDFCSWIMSFNHIWS